MIGVNLIPQHVQLSQARRRRIQRWSGAGIVAAGLLMIPLGLDWSTRAKADTLKQRYERSVKAYQTLRTELRESDAAVERARTRIERAEAMASKRAWSSMLVMITDALPDGAWLTTIETDPPTPTGGTRSSRTTNAKDPSDAPSVVMIEAPSVVMIEAPQALRLVGYAPKAADPLALVSNLKNSGVFERVDLKHSTRETAVDGSYFRFELICEW